MSLKNYPNYLKKVKIYYKRKINTYMKSHIKSMALFLMG